MAAAAGAKSTVRMPGIVLSSLMFQHLNNDSDVEGVILGESIFEEQVTINDTQTDLIHIEETFNSCNIPSIIMSPSLHTGENLTFPSVFLKESVIGWYKQRRNTAQQMTLREKTIHKNLKMTLSNPHMIFLLLTPSYFTVSGSTHKTEYAAYILRCSQVTNIPVLVNNLSLLDPVSYCKAPALCSAVGYNVTIKKHRSNFFSSNGCLNEVEDINNMNDSLQSVLYNMCRDVENSERQLEALQLEVSALRRKVNEQKTNMNTLPEPKRNILLHEAVRALFGGSPLFQSQTLTIAAFPILDFCSSLQTNEGIQGPPEITSGEDIKSERIQRKWMLGSCMNCGCLCVTGMKPGGEKYSSKTEEITRN
uniref:Abraxas 1, BRCA1 A complex subunit n=1 Tax=Neogobius melanostomus TaxID=47308 RepID=A0A8C6UU26_9GOBI